MSVRCSCGRFARWDAYYARWWCDRCARSVPTPTQTAHRHAVWVLPGYAR